MKIAQINTTCGMGSTGKICLSISKLLQDNEIDNRVYYSESHTDYPYAIRYATKFDLKFGALRSRMIGNYGFNSRLATKKLISELKSFDPDIVHIHNIHGHNCDLRLLSKYLHTTKKKVIWTFHDCWAFTGYCTYFTALSCDKWKDGCNHCPQRKKYSWLLDNSSKLYDLKRELFTGLELTIVTPSMWLSELVKKSFLREYPVNVIHNGIELNTFKQRQSSIREKLGIPEDSVLLLGVAFDWGYRKGLDVFNKLSEILSSDYIIVMVGVDDKIRHEISDRIIKLNRTKNQIELSELYSTADIFINPTREDNYPTVNMESIACGTPVITFDTGGSPEMISEGSGIVVQPEDLEGIISAIEFLMKNKNHFKQMCLEKATQFDQEICFKDYINLYYKVLGYEQSC